MGEKSRKLRSYVAFCLYMYYLQSSRTFRIGSNKTVFYGKELNHVRRWYFWLRRQLGLKKAIDTIKKIGDHEKRIANDIIHKITRDCQSSYRNRFANSIRQIQRVAKPREERKRKEV
jgi:hypothetical protein